MKRSIIADLSLLLVAFVWGITFVIVQNAIETLPPFTFNAIRFFMAAVLLFLILLLFFKHQLQLISLNMLLRGFVLGIFLFGGYALQTIGLLYTTSSKAGFITGLSVALIPVFSFVLFKQKLRWPTICGVAAATTGLYLLTLGDSLSLNQGDLLVFFCAICFALHIILTGRYAPHYPAMSLAFIQILTVSLLNMMGAYFFEDWQAAIEYSNLIQPSIIWALLITAGPATVFAFLTQTICQKFTTPTRVALIYTMEPVFAAMASFFWTDDMLGFKALVGCLLILVGMIFSELHPEQLFSKRDKKMIH